MQKNIRLNFLHNKLSRFIFFCFLLCSLSLFLFAENSFVLSPVEGNWSNYQSIIIDVPEGATAFYSFTGDNVEQKLAIYILDIFRKTGDINIKLNKKHAAQSLNIGRTSLYRALDEWEASGIIDVTEKNIIIHDPEGLERKTQ